MEVLTPPPTGALPASSIVSTAPSYRGDPVHNKRVRAASQSPLADNQAQPANKAVKASEFELLTAGAPLGSGGYGTVVQARQLSTGVLVAAKVVPHARLRNMKPAVLRDEYALLQRFAHVNVVAVRGFEEAPGVTTIFTELCETDLFALTRRKGGLPEAEARAYAVQLLTAVDFLHLHGCAHRDLKLENVLLDAKGVCKLCDFGLAVVFPRFDAPEQRWLTEICGSRSYAAPEVLAGRGYDAYASDVWSCGICIFAMCAGFFPLDQASAVDWRFERLQAALASGCSVAHTIYGFYERPCAFTVELVEVLDSVLTIEPLRRPTPGGILTKAWTEGRALITDDGTELEPRYRLLDGLPRSPSGIQAVLADEVATPQRPVYRGGPGASLAVPPELARQPPFREEPGFAKALREASERLVRLPQELLRDASERMPKDGGCVIS